MEKEINLKSLFNIIKRRFWIMAVITILAGLVGGIYSFFMKTPLYSSSARILIPANPEAMGTLKVMIKEPVVLEKVAQQLNLKKSAGALSGQISVGKVEESQIVTITAIDTNPVQAAQIANVTANVYKEEAKSVMNFGSVRILTEANAQGNPSPINLNHAGTIELAMAAAFILSIGIVFLLDSLDETIKSERDIEKLLPIPVLGSVSQMKKNNIVDKNSQKESVMVGGKTFDS
ncbi:chain length determinant family protein [Bacillus pseudomycoides]|uniref:YveK family protein n=1 Tax=Bacillus TaxID=1386 RepID=UPI00035E3CFF|nr:MULTISPECIES: Wzz/FepE/Etk N-terminal domain-containing protein [Bacillus]AIK38426.1 chain length determinant family protein [Bacillus pseudomycoides]AJI17740.1 chain length determinant family protein [Bacillus pseudomycoides]